MHVLRFTRAYLRPSIILLQSSSSFSSYSSSAAAVEAERAIRDGPRNDWTRPEIKSIYDSPLLDLLFHGVCSLSLSCSVFLMDLIFLFFAFKSLCLVAEKTGKGFGVFLVFLGFSEWKKENFNQA